MVSRKPSEAEDGSKEPKDKEEREKAYESKQNELVKMGAMKLVLRVLSYAPGTDSKTIRAAVKLGCQLLDGGNAFVQGCMMEYFADPVNNGRKLYLRP